MENLTQQNTAQLIRNTDTYNIPLSFQQKRAFFLMELNEENNPIFNICPSIKIKGPLNLQRLEKSILLLYKNNTILRTYFSSENGEIFQQISNAIKIESVFKLITLNKTDAARGAKEAENIIREEATKAIDIFNAPLIRFLLIEIAPNDYHIAFIAHHIIEDFGSINIVWNNLRTYYNDSATSRSVSENIEQLQYSDYAAWQNNLLQTDLLADQESYWLKEFETKPQVIDLALDLPRPAIMKYEGATISLNISQDLKQKLTLVGFRNKASLMPILITAYAVLLEKYSKLHDITVGTFFSGRNKPELVPMIAFLSTVLPIRVISSNKTTFKELLHECREKIRGAMANQDYPFEMLVKKINPRRDLSISPVFQATFNMLVDNTMESLFEGTEESEMEILELPVSQYDLSLNAIDKKDGMQFTFEYSTNLLVEDTVKDMLDNYVHILETIAQNPDITLNEFNLLSKIHSSPALKNILQNPKEYDKTNLVHIQFELQAAKTPDSIAVKDPSGSITYSELNKAANKMARFLKLNGLTGNYPVGICSEQKTELVISILAIIKAGGIYVPLDPNYPKERLRYISGDSNMKLILTQGKYKSIFDENLPVFTLEKALLESAEFESSDLDVPVKPDDKIYIIYTSGSTGKPKGSAIYQSAFANLMNWYITDYNFSRTDSILLISSLNFDLTQKNLFAPLLKGGSLALLPMEIFDPKEVVKNIASNEISWLNCAPSVFYSILHAAKEENFKDLKSVKHLFLGGEPILTDILLPWKNSENYNAKIINSYGPTECTDVCTAYTIENFENNLKSIPIGKPIYNTLIAIVDENLRIVEAGTEGELCILGEGVSDGYLNNEALSSEKFITVEYSSIKYNRLYRTGDRAKILNDGNIEFLGRKDNQVKFHGFRIELMEIENAINSFDSVEEAIVVMHSPEAGNKQLVAYIKQKHNKAVNVKSLRSFMNINLPQYMIPSEFVILDKFPLTPNGKVNRLELSDRTIGSSKKEFETEEVTQIQKDILIIWQKILKRNEISIYDNFYEIGGHSFLAIYLVAEIRKKHKTEISLLKLFSNPTIASMAENIEKLMIKNSD